MIKTQEFPKKVFALLKKNLQKLPSISQWQFFFKVLSRKEKVFFLACFVSFLSSSIFLSVNFYLKKTEVVPADGGIYTEGLVGQPRFINPVLASSDIDRDLTELLFASLMKVKSNGEIVPELIKNYSVKEEGKLYEITLRDDIFWHDGQEITSDDVFFTIKTIQDPEFRSPIIANWQGVKVEKISEKKLTFRLKEPYFPFLERLTIKILPKHIFENISAENFPLAIYNLQPIGSGPFKFKEITHSRTGKIEALTLIKNGNYFKEQPYLGEIKFLFFETEADLVRAAEKKEIQGLILPDSEAINSLEGKGFVLFEIPVFRYFAVFFNLEESNILAKKNVREALNLATNRLEILEKVIANRGEIVQSPILPKFYGFALFSDNSEFDLEKAKEKLKTAGFVEKEGKLFEITKETTFFFEKDLKKGSRGQEVKDLQKCLGFFSDIYPEKEITGYFGELTEKAVKLFQEKYQDEILKPWGFEQGTGMVSKTTRKKLNEVCNQLSEKSSPLKLSLTTVNQPFLKKTAEILKEQWEKLGIEIEIKVLEFNELKREVIKPRQYEMVLFGEALGTIPDPFAFWHSSRKKDPGLNLAMYENKKADELLKKARTARDFTSFRENLEAFQNVLTEDKPAIFLYSPNILYLIDETIKGTNFGVISDPSKRFVDIENWYTETKRVWK